MSHMVVATLALAALASGGAPGPAPQFNTEVAIPSVVVATSNPGESYAIPEECMQQDVICMRYPLWFQIVPIQVVYGDPPREKVDVTTYSHYGQPEADTEESPRVMLLLEQDGRYMMSTYASERVVRRLDGRYYLLVDSPRPVHWLPCSVEGLREPIDVTRFSVQAHFSLDDTSVKDHPRLFKRHEGYASPRFGISVARLGQYLQNLKPRAQDFRCSSDDG